MFFLQKLFEIRDQSNPEAEKPFLSHLDDLRVTLSRILLTLAITTLACYAFRNQLMDVIRHPVEQVWAQTQNGALKGLDPRPSVETWEKAVSISNHAIGLNPAQRKHFEEAAEPTDENFAFHVQSAYHYRIALAVAEEQRDAYVSQIPGLSEPLKKQLSLLVKSNPNAQLDAKGRMVLMQSLNPTEGFMLSVKLAFFAALVISCPFLLYFLLQFVLPGLHKKEQKALFPALAIGFLLFLTGVLFAYFIILPNVLDFFYNYSIDMGIQNDWRIGYYISFATQFVLIFGLAFELPVVVMTLVKIGILSYEMMRTTRSYAVLAIVVIAAIITPTPDILTLGLLAGPMYILYEICIWLAYFMDKKERLREAEEEQELRTRLLTAPGATSRPDDHEHGEEDFLDDHDEEDFLDDHDEEDLLDDHDEEDFLDDHDEEDFSDEEDLLAHEHEYFREEQDSDDDDRNEDEHFVGPDPVAEDLYSQAPPSEPDDAPDTPPTPPQEEPKREEDSDFDPLK